MFIKSLFVNKMTFPFIYKLNKGGFYSIGVLKTEDPLVVDISKVQNLSHDLFGCPSPLQMMADPFIIRENDCYYIFYEELTQKKYVKGADIAVLRSFDGVNWSRMGVAIREKFHLSFPNVFKWKSNYYLIPEANDGGDMRIYKSTTFPLKWILASKPMMNRIYSDPMVYVLDDYIYIWYHTYTDGDELRLIYSTDICGPWIEHPSSPIRVCGNDTRPAGTVNNIRGQLYYFVQCSECGYGTGVFVYRINKLSPTEYADEKLLNNPFLWKNGDTWAKDGMHHFSLCENTDGTFLCAMDGKNNHSETGWRWDWHNFPIMY